MNRAKLLRAGKDNAFVRLVRVNTPHLLPVRCLTRECYVLVVFSCSKRLASQPRSLCMERSDFGPVVGNCGLREHPSLQPSGVSTLLHVHMQVYGKEPANIPATEEEQEIIGTPPVALAMPVTCTAAGDQFEAQPMKQGTHLQPLQELLHGALTMQWKETM